MKSVRFLLSLCLLPILAFGAAARHPGRQVSGTATSLTEIVPLVIVGEGWSQRIILLNVDPSNTPAIGTLSFYTRDAQPWEVDLGSLGKASTFLVNLKPGQTALYETVAIAGTQQLGWAILELNSQGLGDVFGQTVFRKQTAGLPDFICSMVLGGQSGSKLSVFFDNTGGKYTGMGILSSEICSFSCDPVNLRVTVQDFSGNTISQKTITQQQGALYWMNLGADFPETVGRSGTFVVEPVEPFSTELTGFSLQFAPNGAFTVITPCEQL